MARDLKLYSKFLPLMASFLPWISLSILLTLLYALSNVFIMPLIKDISEQIANKNLEYFSNHVINAFLLYIIRLGSEYANLYLMSFVSARFVLMMRTKLYEKLQRLSLDFYSKARFGDILTKVFSDVDAIQSIWISFFQKFLPNAISVVAVLGYLIYLSWQLTLVMIISLPFFAFINNYYSKKSKRVVKIMQEKTGLLSHLFQETVTNMSVVQAFLAEKYELGRFKHRQKRILTSFLKEVQIRSTQEPVVHLGQFVIFLTICWFGGYLVVTDVLSTPELTAYFIGIFVFIENVVRVSKVYLKFYQNLAPSERIFDLLSTTETITGPQNSKATPKNMSICFNQVNFHYPKSKKLVLKNICLTVNEGECTALVGASGAGKSTLMQLLPRFYDPSAGQVSIGGVDLRSFSLTDLRKQIAIVPQEVVLFRGTILENLRYGHPSAKIEDVIQAAKQAYAWDFISKMPNGLISKIGDRGQQLSGGQKQRIAIARAILKKAPILLLDEATSALDTESDAMIQSALKELMKNKTSIVIAHRLTTIKHASQIVVIKDGKLNDIGSHQDLMNRGGYYKKLVNS
tara:strand:+ start:959 stop:2677 length:1719 start_codon:yes stop_codon:yes gene_type:complete